MASIFPELVAKEGPGGFHNTNGGAVDPYYAQKNGAAWPDLATVCAIVPIAARRNRTVVVLLNDKPVEYCWDETDLSDAGLHIKLSVSTGVNAAFTEIEDSYITAILRPDMSMDISDYFMLLIPIKIPEENTQVFNPTFATQFG